MISKAILFEQKLFQKAEEYCKNRNTNLNNLLVSLLTKYLKSEIKLETVSN